MALILSGRELAREVTDSIRTRLAGAPAPGLAVILAGDDPASSVYVASKEKACHRVGIRSTVIRLSGSVSEDSILSRIRELNEDPAVHGILCQLPLPPGIDRHRIAAAVLPGKDVDGFHPENVGRLWRGQDGLFPCTPLGVMGLLHRHGITLEGRHAVILGRSDIVGKPMAAMLMKADCTVTIAHSRTLDLPGLCRTADILVTAVGRPGLVRGDWVKPGAVVIDVGINRLPDGSLAGDVCFPEAEAVAAAITPVPGGVGPLTIAYLLLNTVKAMEQLTS
ncbi:MAG: bifunctional methylenetetrahydrofolate dehydrogenase/methenyltetrahydrofolate cyclohydrolase FolD [Candidatus Fermentibacteraceae bacterium]